MQDKQAYLFRSATEEDAAAIAGLFRSAYEESSHECKDDAYVRSTIASGDDHLWIVCEADAQVVAFTCVRRVEWNRTYETCYSITVPAHRGRGLAKQLFLQSLDLAEARNDCDLVVGYPRNRTMLELTTGGFEKPPAVVGHDGGLNVANGQREFHLITIGSNRRRVIQRVAPPNGLPKMLNGFAPALLKDLAFQAREHTYPSTLLAGPPSGMNDACMEESSPSDAIHINAADTEEALFSRIHVHSQASYISLKVLADKHALIEDLAAAGFKVTAYLPAWHCEASKRFDCVMMVRSVFARAPVSHGIADIVAYLQTSFNAAPPARRIHDNATAMA